MNELQEALSIYSDTFKSEYGFRPRWIGNWTLEEVKSAQNDLDLQIKFKMEEDKNAEIFEQEYIGRVNNPWSIGQLVTV